MSFNNYLNEQTKTKEKYADLFEVKLLELNITIPEKALKIASLVNEEYQLKGGFWGPDLKSSKEVTERIEKIKQIRQEITDLTTG